MTPIHYAADRCQINVIKFLINNGVNINCVNKVSMINVLYVCACMHASVVTWGHIAIKFSHLCHGFPIHY